MLAENPSDLSLPTQEAGFAFRAEMAATNFVFGYWKHLLLTVIVVLVSILVYGSWTNAYTRGQRAVSAEISEVWDALPEAYPGQETEEQLARMRTAADELVVIGAEADGPARAEAYLKAAELYRRLDEIDLQREALSSAAESAKGALLFAARSGIANIDLASGEHEAAIATYRTLIEELDGYLAQQAMMDLGLAYEYLDRPAEARTVYTDFFSRWPDSPKAEAVQERLGGLGDDDVAPAEVAEEAGEEAGEESAEEVGEGGE